MTHMEAKEYRKTSAFIAQSISENAWGAKAIIIIE